MAILRQLMSRDIHACHELYPREQCRLQGQRQQGQRLGQQPVDAAAQMDAIHLWLDMQVARLTRRRRAQQRIHEPDHGVPALPRPRTPALLLCELNQEGQRRISQCQKNQSFQ